MGPAIDKDVAHEAVGLKPATLVPKEIPLIKKNHVLQVLIFSFQIEDNHKTNCFLAVFLLVISFWFQIKITPKQTQTEQVDDGIGEDIDEAENENLSTNPFATVEELERGKLPPEEILSLPMFKVPPWRHLILNESTTL